MIENRVYLTTISRDLASLVEPSPEQSFQNAWQVISQRQELPAELRERYALDQLVYIEGFSYTPTDPEPTPAAWLAIGNELIDPTRAATGSLRTEYYPALRLTAKQVDALTKKAKKEGHELTVPLLRDDFYIEHGPRAKSSLKAVGKVRAEAQQSAHWWTMHIKYPPVDPDRV